MNPYSLPRPRKPKIYTFTTTHYKNTKWSGNLPSRGLLKIGYTERDVCERVKKTVFLCFSGSDLLRKRL